MTTTYRQDFTAGLRRIADLIDEHSDLPLPYEGTTTRLLWFLDTPEQLNIVSKAMGGHREKDIGDGFAGLKGAIDGVRINALVPREQVCTRRVVGTETVEVPDPAALAAVPKVAVEREVVEWDCHPILAGGAS